MLHWRKLLSYTYNVTKPCEQKSFHICLCFIQIEIWIYFSHSNSTIPNYINCKNICLIRLWASVSLDCDKPKLMTTFIKREKKYIFFNHTLGFTSPFTFISISSKDVLELLKKIQNLVQVRREINCYIAGTSQPA